MMGKFFAIISCVSLGILVLSPIVEAKEKPEIALAAPHYLSKGQCIVTIWIHGKEKSTSIDYHGKRHDDYCLVEIPRAEFEKDFKFCVLSGIKVAKSKAEYFADFGGGPAGDRDKYWFEWGNPEYVFPTFYCFLNDK